MQVEVQWVDIPVPSRNESSETQPTVLILEDEKGLADLYTTWLTNDYTVRTTYTATEARDSFGDAVNVALIDRRLPDGSGDEILRWVRQSQPACRTAMVTAVNPDFDIIDMPIDDYLVKPIERSDIVGTVESLNSQRAYDETIRDLHALVKKKTRLESEMSRTELDRSDEYTELQAKIAEARDAADEPVSQLQDGDVARIFREIDSGDIV